MKTFTSLIIAPLVLLGLNTSALAQENPALDQIKQQIIQQVRQDMKQTCDDQGMLSCAGMSKKVCLTVTNELLEQCFLKRINSNTFQLSEAGQRDMEQQIEQCNNKVFKKHGLDKNKLEGCSPEQ